MILEIDKRELGIGYEINKMWTNKQNMKNRTFSVAIADTDKDGKVEVTIGSLDNNIFMFENLFNNTYRRAWKSPDLKNPEVIRVLEDYTKFLAANKYDNVTSRVKKQILKDLQMGYSIDDIAKGIQQEFSSLKTWEAERIARTEVIRVTNMGREIGYVQSGLVKGKQCVITYDDRLCEYCRAMIN